MKKNVCVMYCIRRGGIDRADDDDVITYTVLKDKQNQIYVTDHFVLFAP